MNKPLRVALSATAGVAIGSGVGKVGSVLANKALRKKYEEIDLEFENTLSPLQLQLKSRIEKQSFDLSYYDEKSRSYSDSKLILDRLMREFLDTLRPNQIILFKKAEYVLDKMSRRSKDWGVYFSILGGLSGALIASNIK